MEGRLPPLGWLRAFEAAARHLSFTAAAAELGLTQSAISQQIKSLETFLGQPLFLRRPRSLQLTDAARGYLPGVQSAFRLLQEGTQAFLGGARDATLEIHSNLAFSVFWLTPRLGRFLEHNPWVQLDISTAIWAVEQTRPYASVEIRYGLGDWEGVEGERLGRQIGFPICAPEIAARLDGPSDLLGERLFDVKGMVQGWQSWFENAGVALERAPDINWASTYVVTFEIARRGLGVAMGQDVLTDDLLASGGAVRPFGAEFSFREGYYLITPPQSEMNAAAMAFRAWLLEEIGGVV
ncbi:MAG: LysR family transcriptional regulator [Hyphomicrobiaceae bacterium]